MKRRRWSWLWLLTLIPVVLVATFGFIGYRILFSPCHGFQPSCVRGFTWISNGTGQPAVSVRVQLIYPEEATRVVAIHRTPFTAFVGRDGCLPAPVEVLSPAGETITVLDPPCEGEDLKILAEHLQPQ